MQRRWRPVLASLAGILLVTGLRLSAQHEITADDLKEGEQLFVASCTGCHGPDGDAVFGVDLKQAQFRGSPTDEDLMRTIRNGLPGTGTPPNRFSEPQAANLVAYLRSLVSTPLAFVPGDAARGQAVFEGKGKCVTCHRVGSTGSRLGPDLSDIGALRRVADLEKSLVDPGAEILPANRSYRVVTRDGTTMVGRLMNHDTFVVMLIDAQERLQAFDKASLRSYGFVETSPMPSYRDTLSAEERIDVIRYLAGLKGVKAIKP
jgi:putative heme-binding domain-containing protein